MANRRLPDSPSPTLKELRRLWTEYGSGTAHDQASRNLILEIVRLRRLMYELDSLCGSVQYAWKEETRSHLIALEKMRVLFNDERSRQGGHSSEPPPAPPDSWRRYS
ncbi:hypothetical protein AWB64_01267 [Caballeronia sordidicola]|uniref:Uncharacterized protein n=1 Tax=Caballeronia sordidicola TaxID=196367 RepID=A0A158FF91_CABSO|nr:hypothetical protein [Caballeronia sordidicola]SAL18596.1 hypothetical protein AWB64_01267 [Caballeronia sordidicola]